MFRGDIDNGVNDGEKVCWESRGELCIDSN